MKRCLFCYKELGENEKDFHPKCAKKFFGTTIVPSLPYAKENLKDMARQIIRAQTTVAGVQPKLSMYLDKAIKTSPKLTIVGLWGDFILKPQTSTYPQLPENEDMSMHLAELVGIKTVPHSLIRFADGELCYITRRIDRSRTGEKIPMEDMAQLTLRLSEDKYKSSYERISKTVKSFSANVGFDLIALAEQILFSWVIGNSDMHLKNFSLIKNDGQWHLAPAYDLLNVKLAMPSDREELALVLNGKGGHHQFNADDFKKAFSAFELDDTSVDNLFNRFVNSEKKLCEFVHNGFLAEEMSDAYGRLISERLKRLH